MSRRFHGLLPTGIVIFGGQVRRRKHERVRLACGLAVDWVPFADARRLLARIQAGTVSAVIILDGLVSHSELSAILAAVRRRGIALAYAGRAGMATIARAVVELEKGREGVRSRQAGGC